MTTDRHYEHPVIHATWTGARTLCGAPVMLADYRAKDACPDCARAYADTMVLIVTNVPHETYVAEFVRRHSLVAGRQEGGE